MFEKITAYLAEQLDVPQDELTMDTTFESLGIDSLDTVEMVMELEEVLGVELELEEKVSTIGELVAFVESKMYVFPDRSQFTGSCPFSLWPPPPPLCGEAPLEGENGEATSPTRLAPCHLPSRGGKGVRRLPLRGAVGVSRLRGVWEVSKKKEQLC